LLLHCSLPISDHLPASAARSPASYHTNPVVIKNSTNNDLFLILEGTSILEATGKINHAKINTLENKKILNNV
jgi:cobyric acid synthase